MPKKELNPTQDLISQAEAARLRDVSRASISELIKRGRLTPIVIAGKVLVRRSDVLKFKALKRGRPMSKK
jgi:hypothetical protein